MSGLPHVGGSSRETTRLGRVHNHLPTGRNRGGGGRGAIEFETRKVWLSFASHLSVRLIVVVVVAGRSGDVVRVVGRYLGALVSLDRDEIKDFLVHGSTIPGLME